MMARQAKRSRTIKVDDATWIAALDAAERRGEVLAEQVRRFLERYGKS